MQTTAVNSRTKPGWYPLFGMHTAMAGAARRRKARFQGPPGQALLGSDRMPASNSWSGQIEKYGRLVVRLLLFS
jgi:hypothetical protein